MCVYSSLFVGSFSGYGWCGFWDSGKRGNIDQSKRPSFVQREPTLCRTMQQVVLVHWVMVHVFLKIS